MNNRHAHLKEFEQRYWNQEPKSKDTRTAYEQDKGRVIHSFAFRRLQSKTQVSAPSEGDFHRTRLTHSLEVAQIGEGIRNMLYKKIEQGEAMPKILAPEKKEELNSTEKNELGTWLPHNDLVITACYCHDLGHPPFGHAGEEALHKSINAAATSAIDSDREMMERYGGFEANAHTLRIITRLEPYLTSANDEGMNLARRSLLAILKYPVSYAQYDAEKKHGAVVKCYFESEREFIDWAIKPFSESDRNLFTNATNSKLNVSPPSSYPTLDATIMDVADEIAYSTHDVEDAIFLKRLSLADIQQARDKMKSALDDSKAREELDGILTDERIEQLFQSDAKRKRTISGLIHNFISNICIQPRDQFAHPLLKYSVALPTVQQALLDNLRNIVEEKVINSPRRRAIDIRSARMISNLFAEYCQHDSALIPDYQRKLEKSQQVIANQQSAELRVVADHIAAMTDASLTATYHKLFG